MKTKRFRKITSENELLTALAQGQVQLPLLSFTMEEILPSAPDTGAAALVELRWGERRYRFGAALKRSWTPQAISELVIQAQRYRQASDQHLLLLVPYLSDARLSELEALGVSGVDLCGNGIVVIPNELLVYRTGQPNQFRSEAKIKNVFRGNNPLVARVFLLVPS